MAVNTSTITSGPYTGNDLADTFSYTFRVTDEEQLSVYETDDDGVQTLLTLDTDYTVNSVGDDNGGTITRVAGALPTGYEWYIRSNYMYTQETVFTSQGGFFPDVHEDAFDKLTFLVQQLLDKQNRAVSLPDSYSGDLPISLSDPTPGQYLVWNDDGDGFDNATEAEITADALQEAKDYTDATVTAIGAISPVSVTDGDEQITGLNIHPVHPSATAAVSDSVDSGTDTLRDADNAALYRVADASSDFTTVSGEITALDFTARTAEIGGVNVILVPVAQTKDLRNTYATWSQGKYSFGAVATYTDGKQYISLSNDNTGEPTVSSTWMEFSAYVAGASQLHVDSGSANAYILTAAYGVAPSLYDGLPIFFIPSESSTGASTLNYNGTGAVDVVNAEGSDVSSEIVSGQAVKMYYDATNTRWVIASSQGGGGAKGGGGDQIFFESETHVRYDYTITRGSNAVTAGPVTIGKDLAVNSISSDGATLTVETGENFTIDSIESDGSTLTVNLDPDGNIHLLSVGDEFTISDTTNYNGTYTVATSPGALSVTATTTLNEATETSGTLNKDSDHKCSVGDEFTISNTTNYDGDYTVDSVTSNNELTATTTLNEATENSGTFAKDVTVTVPDGSAWTVVGD